MCLAEAAQLLGAEGANRWRANAYRAEALTIGDLESSVRELFDAGGTQALTHFRISVPESQRRLRRC